MDVRRSPDLATDILHGPDCRKEGVAVSRL